MMKWWLRFFRMAGFLIVILSAFLALAWYVKKLDGGMLSSVATYVFAVSAVGLSVALLIPAFKKRRWLRAPIDSKLVRRRLGAFYYVFWGVLILNFATSMAITLRSYEIELDRSASFTELYRLYHAMSSVSMTFMFASLFLMIRFMRYIQDEGSQTGGDQ